jgi:hypothetical protein
MVKPLMAVFVFIGDCLVDGNAQLAAGSTLRQTE